MYVVRWLALLIEAPMRRVEATLMTQIAGSKARIAKASRDIATAEQNEWQATIVRNELRQKKKHQ